MAKTASIERRQSLSLQCQQQFKFEKFGGAKRDRTADLLHAMQALSQLSYGPIPSAVKA
jgi:hypothetical protein